MKNKGLNMVNPPRDHKSEHRSFLYFFISASLVIALSLSASFLGLAIRNRTLIKEQILERSRAHFCDVQLYRRWNSNYGGVYVEKKEGIESNPYLINPDIEALDGKKYTKKNPALMTREVSEYAKASGIYEFHITSLNLLNPKNKANDVEAEALQLFENGSKEFFREIEKDGKKLFMYMAPLPVEPGCMPCHKHQGYEVGMVRGGVSVLFPIHEIEQQLANQNATIVALSVATTGLVIGIILYLGSVLRKRLQEARALLEQLATRDPLTGIFNRRRFVEKMEEEFKRAKRTQHSFTCAIFDLDHFKRVNDTFGHQTGDAVLKDFAAIVLKCIREYDFFARYGGEEFILLLPNTSQEGVVSVLERIRTTVEAELKCSPDKAAACSTWLNVTASVGASAFRSTDSSINDIIHRADSALYEAKEAGRNLTIVK